MLMLYPILVRVIFQFKPISIYSHPWIFDLKILLINDLSYKGLEIRSSNGIVCYSCVDCPYPFELSGSINIKECPIGQYCIVSGFK
jgi:hypothetical protein